MAKANVAAGGAPAHPLVQGRAVASLGQGMALVKIARTTRAVVPAGESTTVLMKKTARALEKPGIDKSVVFRGPRADRIYAYSVDPQDPTRMIREAADGERVAGRLVKGVFRPSKP